MRGEMVNPPMPELNPSAQRCLPRFLPRNLILKGSLCDVLISHSALKGVTLSVRAQYIYSAAFNATSPDGVYILRDIHTLV
jgi:hypothetical protein